MPAYADQIVWPDGTKTQVFSDGSVKGFGEGTFHGSMYDFKPEHRRTFTKASAIVAHDPNDKTKGYKIFTENGDGWDCPLTAEEHK